jgi:hypothetical protein
VTTKFDKFDYDMVENYYLKNLIANNFWLFGSASSDTVKPTSFNTLSTARDFLGKTIFGTKIGPKDISFMLPVVTWRQDEIYSAFDDQGVLTEKTFYVVVEPDIEGGNYNLFKCISNARNTASVNKPEYTNSIENGLHELPDGYVWKYMSSTPYTTYRRFAARSFIPVVRNAEVENIANDGIYSILVENQDLNKNYELISGIVESLDSITSKVFLSSTVKLDSSDNTNRDSFSTIQEFDFSSPNFYVDRTLYVRKNEASPIFETSTFRITGSGLENSKPYVTVESNTFIEAGDIVQIAPTITITGDGANANAMPIFEEGRIVSTRILNYGVGYTRASATVIDAAQGFVIADGAVKAILRPIVSPDGGHGTNVLRELKCRHIGIAKTISELNSSKIPAFGTYSKIGLVKSPRFSSVYENDVTAVTFDNRLKVITDSAVVGVEVGSTVSQSPAQGIIHQVGEAENTLFVSDYKGTYSESFVDSLPITINAISFGINTIEYSPYVGDSGDVLFIADSTPVDRTEEKAEQIRLIIDF